MKKTTYLLLVTICLSTIIGSLLIYGKMFLTTGSSLASSPTPIPEDRWYGEAKSMPDELMYWVLFQEIQALKEKDIESLTQGETTNFKTSFYTNRLGLQNSQFSALDSAVTECFTALQPVDQRAREVINQYRSQYANGELKKIQPSPSPNSFQPGRRKTLENLPPVPSEIGQLQNQKNQIILNAKEKIRLALGQSEFMQFDESVKRNATKVLVPLNLRSKVLPSLTPTPSN